MRAACRWHLAACSGLCVTSTSGGHVFGAGPEEHVETGRGLARPRLPVGSSGEDDPRPGSSAPARWRRRWHSPPESCDGRWWVRLGQPHADSSVQARSRFRRVDEAEHAPRQEQVGQRVEFRG